MYVRTCIKDLFCTGGIDYSCSNKVDIYRVVGFVRMPVCLCLCVCMYVCIFFAIERARELMLGVIVGFGSQTKFID